MQGVFRTIKNRDLAKNALKKCNVEGAFSGSMIWSKPDDISTVEYKSE
jgi:hypothetical protein